MRRSNGHEIPTANDKGEEIIHGLNNPPFAECEEQDVDERENGYPLIPDFVRLRIHEAFQRSVDEVIEQQAHNEEIIDDLMHNHDALNQIITDQSTTSQTPKNIMQYSNQNFQGDAIYNHMTERSNEFTPSSISSPFVFGEILEDLMLFNGSNDDIISVPEYPAKNRPQSASSQTQNILNSIEAGTSCKNWQGWQATKGTLKERYSFMFCNDFLADVYFIVGRGENKRTIPAHKFVLATGSAVFHAMFYGSMAKSNSVSSMVQEVELPDVEVSAFLALLKFLYSDDVDIEPENVITTLYTAKKYAVPSMENACVEFLKRNLGADNAFMLLTQARLFDEPQLASLCLEIIDKNTDEALNADGFVDIDLETLCSVLSRDTLRIREVVLFKAILRWSEMECARKCLIVNKENQKRVLDDALKLIRFPLMKIDEFAQHVALSGILDDNELVKLFLYFTLNKKLEVTYIEKPRSFAFGTEMVVSRFRRVEGRWGYSGTPDRIKFSVDQKVYVTGFGLHGSIHGPYEYQVQMQILRCGTGKLLASNDTTFKCDGSIKIFPVFFNEPVEILPSITYIASACLKGPDSHYGTKGVRRVTQQTHSDGMITFQFAYAAGNNNGTSVEDGQIPEILFCVRD